MSYLILLLPAVAGVLAHHAFFIRGEWHMRIPNIIAGHSLLLAFTWYAMTKTNAGRSLIEMSQVLSIMAAVYVVALFSSITIYRLWFHQCSQFPGPRLAAVSKLWHVWHIRKSNNFSFMKELHEKYGDVIRTGR